MRLSVQVPALAAAWRRRNNHGTCWVMQVAEFARYVGRETIGNLRLGLIDGTLVMRPDPHAGGFVTGRLPMPHSKD